MARPTERFDYDLCGYIVDHPELGRIIEHPDFRIAPFDPIKNPGVIRAANAALEHSRREAAIRAKQGK